MSSFRLLIPRGRALAAAALLLCSSAAFAQHSEDPGEALSRHLRTLSDEPSSLSSLIGAGNAALELGDPRAAATFFARAEEIAPRDGRVKAGLGAAFLQLEQPHAALKFFGDATSAGLPERQVAGDRGLAHDLIGDTRSAQRDYRLALQGREDDEIRRRLALSLAIGGDRAGALQAIDPQLRRQDRAAWRTRAFILALTGDASGATNAADAVMTAENAAAMRPFFAQLPRLNPAQRASAVHFGHFPADGQPMQMAGAQGGPAGPAPLLADQAGTLMADSAARALPSRTPAREPASSAPRRRPGVEEAELDTNARVGPGSRPDLRVRRRAPANSTPRVETASTSARPVQTAPLATFPTETPAAQRPVEIAAANTNQRWQTAPAPAATAPVSSQGVNSPVGTSSAPAVAAPVSLVPFGPSAIGSTDVTQAPISVPDQSASQAPAPAISSTQLPPSAVVPEGSSSAPNRPVGGASSLPASSIPMTPAVDAQPGFAELASLIRSLPPEGAAAPQESAGPAQQAAPKAVPPAVPNTAPAKASPPPPPPKPAPPKPSPAAKKAAPAPAKAPSRQWVQIAGGANKAALPKEYDRLRAKAPKLLDGRDAWTSELRFTNRLLIGPFKSEKEAQAFVNQLADADLPAFSWTSPEGQEIEKLPRK
jgi:Flp pilus assembly protein TadD